MYFARFQLCNFLSRSPTLFQHPHNIYFILLTLMPPYFETVKVSKTATVHLSFSSSKLYESLRLMISLFILKSFADVPFTEYGVETQSFLEASDGLVQMFGTFVLPFLFLMFQLLNGFVQHGPV